MAESGSGEVLAEFFPVVMAFLGDPGFVEAAIATAFGLDFFGRENEPGSYRFVICLVRYAQHFVEVVLFAGGVESGLAAVRAFSASPAHAI